MGRRGPGEGSIVPRKDGRFQVMVDLGRDALGRRRRKYLYADTHAEAVKLLQRAQREKAQGVLARGGKGAPRTVGAWLDQWLLVVKATREPSTYASYEGMVRLHVRPALGRVHLARLDAAQVERFLLAKLDAGCPPVTVARMRRMLSSAFGQAARKGLLAANVAASGLIELPPAEARPSKVLTLQEARAFLAAVRADRLYALYLTAVVLGLRQAHLLGMRWSDVDWKAATLHLRYKLDRVYEGAPGGAEPREGQWQLRPIRASRTKKTRRSLPLLGPVATALREHQARQELEREMAGAEWYAMEHQGREVDLVFRGRTGKPLHGAAITPAFHRRLRDAGFDPRRFHDLRHSAASIMIALRVPLKTVSEVLGHRSYSITADVYGHLADELLREQLAGVDAAWGDEPAPADLGRWSTEELRAELARRAERGEAAP